MVGTPCITIITCLAKLTHFFNLKRIKDLIFAILNEKVTVGLQSGIF